MEKRQHPRFRIKARQRILYLSAQNSFDCNPVVSKDISSHGFSFRSLKPYLVNDICLVHLQEDVLRDLQENKTGLVKTSLVKLGNYFLAHVKWCQRHWCHGNYQDPDPYYAVGCEFVSLNHQTPKHMDLFMQLVNRDVIQALQ